MWPRRIERVNELLLREISQYVLENQPPEMGFITFTGVNITEDLEQAKVFYSVLGTDAEKARTAELLNEMRPALMHHMRRLESLKRLPELHFLYDETPSRAARIHEVIEELHRPAPPPDDRPPRAPRPPQH